MWTLYFRKQALAWIIYIANWTVICVSSWLCVITSGNAWTGLYIIDTLHNQTTCIKDDIADHIQFLNLNGHIKWILGENLLFRDSMKYLM